MSEKRFRVAQRATGPSGIALLRALRHLSESKEEKNGFDSLSCGPVGDG